MLIGKQTYSHQKKLEHTLENYILFPLAIVNLCQEGCSLQQGYYHRMVSRTLRRFDFYIKMKIMEFKFVKIAVFTPISHVDKIRKILNDSGAGCLGKYDNCSFSTKGIGRFRGLEGSNPAIGEVGKIEEVEEEKIEVICPYEKYEKVVAAVKKAHPYEEPAIDVYPLLRYI